MKHAVFAFLVVLLATAHASAQDDPCAGITCSGAGACTTTGAGVATCQCNEGFAPDATGLNCLVVVTGTAPAPAPALAPAPETCPTAEEVLLQVNKGRAIKQLVVWPIFFVLSSALFIGGAVIFDRDSKLWPLHLAMMVTGGFIAASSLLIIAIYAARVARINKRLRECRGIACVDFAEDTQLAFHPFGLTLSF